MYSYDMITQNQVKRVLSEPSSIQYVCQLLESKEIPHRSALAALVCEQFRFHDARGQQQGAGCLKALRELEAAGHFTLPVARRGPGRSSPGVCRSRFHYPRRFLIKPVWSADLIWYW